jgi:hypothetical protein
MTVVQTYGKLRFPNGIHTAAWYPWILYALTQISMSSSLKKTIIPSLILVFSTVCMITGGYPYFVYYSVFLLAPYALMLFLRPTRTIITGQTGMAWKAVLPALGFSGGTILLLGLPYPYASRLTDMAHCRTGKDFNYSTNHAFTVQGHSWRLDLPAAFTDGGVVLFQPYRCFLSSCYLSGSFFSPKSGLSPDSLIPCGLRP